MSRRPIKNHSRYQGSCRVLFVPSINKEKLMLYWGVRMYLYWAQTTRSTLCLFLKVGHLIESWTNCIQLLEVPGRYKGKCSPLTGLELYSYSWGYSCHRSQPHCCSRCYLQSCCLFHCSLGWQDSWEKVVKNLFSTLDENFHVWLVGIRLDI